MGRVLGFSLLLSSAAMPVGAVLGFLMTAVDPAVVFRIAAAFKGLEVLIARFSAINGL